VAPKAEKAGVILGLESWLSAEQHRDILDRVGSPAVQVYYDLGNSHKQGYDIYKEIRFLGKNICEFHAKDYNDLYGKGTINFPEVRRAMDDVGYRGWIHIEGVKMPLGLEGSVRYDEEYLRSIFPRQT
jgi:sugar phosphate isomerase/epimerase